MFFPLRYWPQAILLLQFLFVSGSNGIAGNLLNFNSLDYERQSAYEFRHYPGYMLLSMNSLKAIEGQVVERGDLSPAWWIYGRMIGPGVIELAFSKARPQLVTPDVGPGLRLNIQPWAEQQPPEDGITATFHYLPPTSVDGVGTWTMSEPVPAELQTMSEFRHMWSNLSGVEAMLVPWPFIAETPETWKSDDVSSRNIVGIFGSAIIEYFAGLPTDEVYVTPQYCANMVTLLQDGLKATNRWDVKLHQLPLWYLDLEIKSHSSRDYFYGDNYWWKAFFELEFSRYEEPDGICRGVKVRLVDSIVCPGPASDDPDNGRKDCYQRTDYRSNAESSLGREISLLISDLLK